MGKLISGRAFGLIIMLLGSILAKAQDYHAIQGSNYAGSLGIYNNPASMVNTPFTWDLTLAGVQVKYQTNAVRVIDYSLLSSPATSKLIITGGEYKRYGNLQANVNLFNTRIAWGRRRAIAVGANIRSVSNVFSSNYNYRDTISSIQSFFSMNETTGPYDAKFRSSSLLEICLSYGQTILERGNWRLNGGLTVKLNRGLAGLRAELNDINMTVLPTGDGKEYQLNGGNLAYGYSSNIDLWDDNRSSSTNLVDFFRGTRTGVNFDAGLELLIRPDDGPEYMQAEDAYFDYDWKIGASLLDIGWGQYRYGVDSRRGELLVNSPTANRLDVSLDSTVSSLSDFTDSLSSVLPLAYPGADYKIFSAARILLNVDRWLAGAFYLNTELSLNLASLLGKNRMSLKNINLIRVTARWETQRWGLYLPLQFNNHNQFWVGAAAKAGPLLIGFHNLGNVFGNTKMANGGGYIALTIRSAKIIGNKKQKQLDCPPY